LGDYLFVNGHHYNFINSDDQIIFNNDFIFKIDEQNVRIENNALILSTSGSNINYFHFIVDFVPKFLLYINEISKFDLIIINGPIELFVKEFMGLFSITNLYVSNNKESVMCRRSIVPTSLSITGNPSSVSIDMIRENLLPFSKLKSNYSEKIYVSRKNSNRRKVINEKKVEKYMISKGFDVVNLEELSLIDQITTFKFLKLVISPHGAGMTNLVFSDSGVKAVELFSSGHIEPCMYNICCYNKIDYYYMVFDSLNSNHDYSIDLKRLDDFLNTTGILNYES
jgi:capsular polysaccharide biosynthesis protein